jgi:hypothetical protein
MTDPLASARKVRAQAADLEVSGNGNGKAEDIGFGEPASLLQCFDTIEAKPVRWLWPRRIPCGMPSILFGMTGLGKSQVYTDIVSRVSNGSAWPDGGRAPAGNCVILSAEDDAETVLKPRLVYAGADCSKVFLFPSVAQFDDKGRRTFSLVVDLEVLQRNMLSVDAVLGIIDPITAYLSGVDSHVVTEIRGALAMVDDTAKQVGAAILCIMHPNKNGTGDVKAVQRMSGSGAFGDAPRSVMLVAEDPDHKEAKRRLLLPAKMNLGAMPDGLGFHIGSSSPLTCDSGIVWDGEPVTLDADEVLKPRHGESDDQATANEFLSIALADGEWHSARDLQDDAESRGIKPWTLKRARRHLEVMARKGAFRGGWEWKLPMEEIDDF